MIRSEDGEQAASIMALKFSLKTPTDYLLSRDYCSYGYFLLSPNHWYPEERTFRTTLDLSAAEPGYKPAASDARTGAAVTVVVSQPGKKRGGRGGIVGARSGSVGAPLCIEADRNLSAEETAITKRMLIRALRLDEPAETIAEFHAVDPRWATRRRRTGGRAAAGRRAAGSNSSVPHGWSAGRGRLMRSSSFFEDVIKTVTSCNVTWPSTIIMNTRLCRVVGARSRSGLSAFPTPERLARVRPATLRAQCTVGYRDARIVELARMFALGRRVAGPGRAGGKQADAATGAIDAEFFERCEAEGGVSDDDLFELLQEWPGIGPYAAANILQLLGRYSRLPLDTESVRHGRTVLGMKGSSARIMKWMHRHFDPFGAHKFRAYWFELWRYYEAKRGPAWTWERETTGKTFTAALLD